MFVLINHPAYSKTDKTGNQSSKALYDSVLPEKQYRSERKKYKTALKVLKKGNRKEFRAISKKLKDYPLYTYLKYYELKRYISTSSEKEMSQFFKDQSDSPAAWWLRNAWLDKLAEQGKWKTFIKYYLPDKKTKHDCYYHWGQYKLGKKKAAYAGAKSLWLVGKSQPDACNPLFKVWRASNAFKPDYDWQRIGLAVRKGKASLASYLKRNLPKSEQRLVDLWLKVRKNPRLLSKTKSFRNGPKNREIIMYGLGRLALFDLDRALLLWTRYNDLFDFTEEELAPTRTYIAKLLAFDFHTEAGLWLEQANEEQQDYELHQRQIRTALREQNWQEVIKWITLLPIDKRRKSEWQYWKARALQALGAERGAAMLKQQHFRSGIISRIPAYQNVLGTHLNFVFNLKANIPYDQLTPFYLDIQFIQRHNASAKDIFHTIAQERSFYGFLSSRFIEKPINLNMDEIEVEKKQLRGVIKHRGIQRARELLLTGSELNAKREWVHTIKQLSPSERAIAAKLAAHWDWPFYAIYTASRSDNKNDIDLRFPRIHHNTVSKNAQKNNISTEWVFSIIRQESAFRKDARSPVGALGIMQIMPATAKYVSRKIGEKYKGNRKLLDPKHNIKLGSSYLSQLLKQFDGNMVMATAAYNAGPHRVKQWRPVDNAIPGDIWIETIPIKETREYVKNVVAFQAIYQYQLGLNPELTQAVIKIDPPPK